MDTPQPSVHIRRDQFHLAWDRSIEPIATVASHLRTRHTPRRESNAA